MMTTRTFHIDVPTPEPLDPGQPPFFTVHRQASKILIDHGTLVLFDAALAVIAAFAQGSWLRVEVES